MTKHHPIQNFINTTLGVSLISAVGHQLFTKFLGAYAPQSILSLSLWGIKKGFIWQFFTYLFLQPFQGSISVSYLINLAFSVYLLWFVGLAICERKGVKQCLLIYLGSGIFCGIAVFFTQWILNSPIPFSGNWATLFSLTTAWVILNPYAELRLFMTIPVKALTLLKIVFWGTLIMDLSRGDYVGMAAYTSAALVGYFYPILIWKERSPFKTFTPSGGTKKTSGNHKEKARRTEVYDIQSGKEIILD